MRIVKRGEIKVVTLYPGEYYVSRGKVVISTLLGSCVSACLYDPVNRVVGMNHFLLSNKRYSKHMPMYATEAGRYGINVSNASFTLINNSTTPSPEAPCL